eukprot:m.23270 g.23270  ORF g.23270 m.23270 type:complete len:109 (-) comp11358_c0_seq3:103-429(-)
MFGCLGYWRLAWRHKAFGLREVYRSFMLEAQVEQLRRYIPELTAADVTRGPAGVRAQALHSDGRLVEDFVLRVQGCVCHVVNAPSPAATSSLAIANHVYKHLQGSFSW